MFQTKVVGEIKNMCSITFLFSNIVPDLV